MDIWAIKSRVRSQERGGDERHQSFHSLTLRTAITIYPRGVAANGRLARAACFVTGPG